MAYGKDKIRLTVAVDEELNEKLEVFSEAFDMSKTNLIIDLLNQNIYNYVKVWESINTVNKINAVINAFNKCNKDTHDLLKIKKVLVTKPLTVQKADILFQKLSKESKKVKIKSN